MKNVFSALVRAYNKWLSLSANYPKGFGELFIKWMMYKHPWYVLYHVEKVRGSRQDMILEALLAIYTNWEVNIELLDESLRIPGKRRDNILMRNLFVLLALPKMAAQSCFLCMVYFSICSPMRWLVGKTHDIKDFPVGDLQEEKWCTWSMGRVLDTLYEKLGEIIAFPSLLLSEQ